MAHSRAGVPLVFLAQVDCSALPSPEPWADTNPWAYGGQLLRVFADLIDPDYGPSVAVGLACSPDSELRRVQRPPAPDPLPRRLVPGEDRLDDSEIDDRFHDIEPTAVALVPSLTAPERHPVLFPGAFALDERAERYERWAMRLRVDGAALDDELRRRPWQVSHLLGEAVSVQDDPRYHAALVHRSRFWADRLGIEPEPALKDSAAWRVLLALRMGPDFDLAIYDFGAFHLLAPIEDLAVGRYDRLVCDVSSG